MGKLNVELLAELGEDGIIENLQKKIISFIRTIDYINAELSDIDNSHFVDVAKEVDTIKCLLADIQITQKMADELFENLSTEQRKNLRSTIPDALRVFGWHGLLTENGEIKNRH